MSDSAPVQNNFSSDAVQYAKKASYYAPSTGGGAGSGGVTQIVVDAVDLTGSVTLEGLNGVTVTQNGSGTITIDGTLGGVTSIVAGTGITIDPTSGLGAVTVNADAAVAPGYGIGYNPDNISGANINLAFLGGVGSGTNATVLSQLTVGKAYTGVFNIYVAFPNAGAGSSPSQNPNIWYVSLNMGGINGGTIICYKPASSPFWGQTVTFIMNPDGASAPTPANILNKNLTLTLEPFYYSGSGSAVAYTTFVGPTVPIWAIVNGFAVECNSQTVA